MNTILLVTGCGIAVFFAYLLLRLSLHRGSREFLSKVRIPDGPLPTVSVVIAARNEERNIEEALLSVLAQEHEGLQVVVIDDRSTDRTGVILDELAARNGRLKVVHITELPAGWLGKNHALSVGAGHAGGDWLLFTDADVVMKPTVVSRAVAYAVESGADHLAIGPEVRVSGTMLNAFVASFMMFFMIYARPWGVRNPRSSAHIGIGAFNMLRREVYHAIGGHEAIAMRPDDDMKLGKLVKKSGFRQDLLSGLGMLWVEWYGSVSEAVRGLEKNTFAGVDYHLSAVVAGSIFSFLGFCWPFIALFITSGPLRWLNILIVLLLAGIHGVNGIRFGVGFRYFFLLPAGTLLMIFILWRSSLLTLVRRGIDWRGTHYSLEELRKNRI